MNATAPNCDSIEAPFWDHVEELRRTFIKSFVVICVSIACAFAFYQDIFAFLTSPLQNREGQGELISYPLQRELIQNKSSSKIAYTLPHGSMIESHTPEIELLAEKTYLLPPNSHLIISKSLQTQPLILLSPLDGMTIALKTCFWLGLIGSSPIWLFFVLQFVAPALEFQQRRLLAPFLFTSCAMVACGMLFAFFVTIPVANQYLSLFNQTLGINQWTLSHYLDYTLFLMLGNGFAFELFVIGLFLVHFGKLTGQTLARYRRHFIVAAFIVSAILTPPDIFTQLMMAIPLVILYEMTILYARFRAKERVTNP